MSHSIVITSGKGGVGKSMAAVNLACTYASAGKTVVLVDADTGLRSLDILLGMENDIVYDLTDVAEGVCRLKQAIVPCKAVKNLSLIAAAQLRDTTSVTPEQLIDIVSELKSGFDLVIIDCPAGADNGFRVAASGADTGIIIATPDAVCIRDAERISGLLERYSVTDRKLILNRALYEKKPGKGGMYSYEETAQKLELPLIGLIPDSDAIRASAICGVPAVLRDSSVKALFEEIKARLDGKTVEIRPVKKKSWFRR